jgi:hypothetical protein
MKYEKANLRANFGAAQERHPTSAPELEVLGMEVMRTFRNTLQGVWTRFEFGLTISLV